MKNNMFDKIKMVGIIVAILIALTQLWDWFKVSNAAPVATLTLHKYAPEPSFVSRLEKIKKKLSKYKDEDLRLDVSDLKYDAKSRGAVWFVEVHNDGNKVSKSVKLKLPDVISTSIKREGGKYIYSKSSEVIELGQLQPSESISLYVWVEYYFEHLDSDDIRLTHEDGVGKVIVFKRASPLWAWLDRNWDGILWFMFMISPLIYIVFVIINHKKRESVSNEPDKTT